jgi:hypothetical protein
MSLDELNQEIASRGGRWVKLRNKGDVIEGEILDFVRRDRTDPEGNIVYKRGTTQPRTEWVFTLATDLREEDDDDGVRRVPCNESAQGAVSRAVKESGAAVVLGGRLKLGVAKDPEGDFSQPEFIARYTPPTAAAEIDLEGF